MLTTLLFALELKFILKIESNTREIQRILFCCKALRKRLEHSRSGEKIRDVVEYFFLHFFRALVASACFTTEQSTVKASLLVK